MSRFNLATRSLGKSDEMILRASLSRTPPFTWDVQSWAYGTTVCLSVCLMAVAIYDREDKRHRLATYHDMKCVQPTHNFSFLSYSDNRTVFI